MFCFGTRQVDLISPVLNGNGPKSGDLQESEAKTEALTQMADVSEGESPSKVRRLLRGRGVTGRRGGGGGLRSFHGKDASSDSY